MNLSEHFTLAEFERSNKAVQLGLDNKAPADLLPRLIRLAELLERVRSTLNVPITVTSGYRGRQLNSAVGGVTNSDHSQGQAADIVAPQFGTPYQVAKVLAPLVSTLGIGQLIYEKFGNTAWVHVSTRIPDNVANRVITITGKGASVGILELA